MIAQKLFLAISLALLLPAALCCVGHCDAPFRLKSQHSGLYLTGGAKSTTVVTIQPDNYSFYQLWCFDHKLGKVYQWVDGQVLDIRGDGDIKPATDMIVYADYHGQKNQQFKFNTDGTVETLAKAKYVLDVYGHGKKAGTKLIIYPRHGHLNQRFTVEAFGKKSPVIPMQVLCQRPFLLQAEHNLFALQGADNNKIVTIQPLNKKNQLQLFCYDSGKNAIYNAYSGNVLDIRGGGDIKSGAEIISFSYNHGHKNQQFKFNTDGTVETLAKTRFVLDVYQQGKKAGTKVTIYPRHGHLNQRFRIVPLNQDPRIQKHYLCTKPFYLRSQLNGYAATGGKGLEDVILMYPKQSKNPYQMWCLDVPSKGVMNYMTGHVLDVKGGAPVKKGAEVINYFYHHGGANQQWSFPNDKTIETLAKKGYKMDVFEGSKKKGTKVIVWPHHGKSNQKWTVDYSD